MHVPDLFWKQVHNFQQSLAPEHFKTILIIKSLANSSKNIFSKQVYITIPRARSSIIESWEGPTRVKIYAGLGKNISTKLQVNYSKNFDFYKHWRPFK